MAQLIAIRQRGVALGPEDLARASTAFEGAWRTVAATYGRDLSDRSADECRRLARIVIELAQNCALTADDIVNASIDRMHAHPR